MSYSVAFLNARFMNNVAAIARTCALMHCGKLYFSPDPHDDRDGLDKTNLPRCTLITNSVADHKKLDKYSQGYASDIEMEFLENNDAIICVFTRFLDLNKNSKIVFLEGPIINDPALIGLPIESIFSFIKESSNSVPLFVVGGERTNAEGIPIDVMKHMCLTYPNRAILATIPVKNCPSGKGNTSGNVAAMISVVMGAWMGVSYFKN